MSDSETESSTSDHFEDAEESVEAEMPPPPAPPPGAPVVSLPSPDIEDHIHMLTGDGVAGRDHRWRRLEILRRKGEEEREGGREGSREEEEERATPGSTESSVEGIYVAGVRGLHPFKVVESDARSVQSESRSGVSVSRSSCRVSMDSCRISVEDSTLLPPLPPPRSPPPLDSPEERVEPAPPPAPSLLPVRGEELLQQSSAPSLNSPPNAAPAPYVPPQAAPAFQAFTPPMGPPVAPQPIAPPRKKRGAGISREESLEEASSPSSSARVSPAGRRPDSLAWGAGEAENRPRPLPSISDIQSVAGLNMSAAMRGDFVVRPSDDEHSRGSSAPCGEGSPRVGGGSTGPGLGDFSQDPSGSVVRPSHSHSHSEGEIQIQKAGSLKGRSRGHDGYMSGGSGGHHSSSSSKGGQGGRGSGESRKSGDSEGGLSRQANVFIRTKSDSGKRLTDQEILRQIKVKNLDTGAEMDLQAAEEQLPQSINPLSLHIMRQTGEYTGIRFGEDLSLDSDDGSMVSSSSGYTIGEGKKKATFGRLLNNVTRSAKNAAKGLGLTDLTRRQMSKEEKEEEKLGRLATDIAATDGVQVSSDGAGVGYGFKRIQAHKSGPYDFENIQFGQDLSGHHQGAIWCMKFSLNGWLLATAGQDCILRIWVLRDKHQFFNEMRRKYQQENNGLTDEQIHHDEATRDYFSSQESIGHIFMDRPFVTYTGHTSDLLDISWSKNYFILTSSMDKTVRLWHISRKECLCVFQHIDCVTALAFNPKNDQFFISGSLDGKIRLWNIPDKKVALWNEVPGPTKLITAANYCQHGKFAVVGTYDGRCIFFSTDQLKYHTTIHVRSARGKNSRGRKVTGIEPMPGEDKILITSNDSRIRLYDLRDLSLVCKYKGYTNLSSQIRAAFSPDGRYICSGSENQCVFLWSSLHTPQALTARKDRNNYYEAIRAHSSTVTCSLFAPDPRIVFEAVERGREAAGKAVSEGSKEGYVVISGDFDGDIKIFINQTTRSPSQN